MQSIRVFAIAAATLMLAASCQKEIDVKEQTSVLEFSATYEQPVDEGETKTALSGTSVVWSANDQVKVYDATGKTGTLTAAAGGSASTTFSGDVEEDFNSSSACYAIYPASAAQSISGSTITFTLPATQTYAENSFGQDCNVAVGAVSGGNIAFKNACGYLKLPVSLESGDAAKVGKIILKGNNGEKISGTFTVDASLNAPVAAASGTTADEDKVITLDCGDGVELSTDSENPTVFYFVVPVGAFSDATNGGFTAEVYSTKDHLITTLSTTKSANVINRSKVRVMPITSDVKWLPSTYTEVEYIESTGTQYIDMDVKGTRNSKIEVRFMLGSRKDRMLLFGATGETNSGSTWYYDYHRSFFVKVNNANTYWYPSFGTQARTVIASPYNDLNTIHTTVLSSEGWYYDGECAATFTQDTDFETPVSVYLFYGNGPDGTLWERNRFEGKVYYAKFWESGSLIRNLIPAQNTGDLRLGMYDLAATGDENKFYTNVGTGSFTGE